MVNINYIYKTKMDAAYLVWLAIALLLRVIVKGAKFFRATSLSSDFLLLDFCSIKKLL